MSKIEVNQIASQIGGVLTIGASGDTVTLAAGASQSGFGRTGTVNWDTTKKTANFTAVSGVGYFLDTTTTTLTITLPATPSAGDIVAVADYDGTALTNNITVGRNSSNINGSATDLTINANYSAVTLIYVDSTTGWRSVDSSNPNDIITPQYVAATGGTISTCGNYKIHSFTGPGTFTVTNAGNPAGSATVDYMVVAGGGSGGVLHGSGGGAGGFRESVPSPAAWTASPLANPGGALPVSVQGYPITVGGGGTAPRTSGSNSVFSTITSAGGGGGAVGCSCTNKDGLSGGSGSGSATGSTGLIIGSIGSGNTPPVAPPQGNNGGLGSSNNSTYRSGGGGGGATVVGTGTPNPTEAANPGGNGATTSISGTPTAYAGGGGGGSSNSPGIGAGGTGGGGTGGFNGNPSPARNATTNTGGGGGGSGGNAPDVAGNGGSGIVVIRYKYQ
jgi:hypothetical protein